MKLVVTQCTGSVPVAMVCRVLGLNRSTVYWRKRQPNEKSQAGLSRKDCYQPRALSENERQQVMNAYCDDRFVDQSPPEIHMALLEEGRYWCSLSTVYRLLRAQGQSGERRKQRPAQHHAVPRLCASRPNEVWTWDITKLATARTGEYLSLYVVMDLYSRFVLAWMLSRKENSALSQQLMREAIARYAIAAGQLTIHQDRGSPMIAHGYLDLLSELGATSSHSRPRVSNDNPFSESQFKTLKYQPDYPRRFTDTAHARAWCDDYFNWYNFDHHHGTLAGFTPEQVFTGRYAEIANQREQVLLKHYEQYPQRYVRGKPKVKLPPSQVMINPMYNEDGSINTNAAVNFPTLPAAKKSLILN